MELSAPITVRAQTNPLLLKALLIVAAIGVAALLPIVTTNSYYLFLFTFAGMYVFAAMGYNIIAGYAGIISLAHGALICLGAYATAILCVTYGWNFWSAAAAATVIGVVASAVISLPALRLSSWYFVLITIAFTTAVTAMVTDLRGLTGGYGGIVGVPPPSLFGHAFTTREMYWFILALNIVGWWILSNLIHSRIGWSFRAVRDVNISAANGVSTVNVRLLAFLLAGGVAGLSGACFAVLKIVVTPEDFPFDFSIFFLFVIVLGGSARLSGPLLGVLAFYVLPELLGNLKEYRMIVYGGGLLAFSVFLPEGIAGAVAILARRWGLQKMLTSTPTIPTSSMQRTGSQQIGAIAGGSLSIESVGKDFGGVRALDTVDITINPGDIHAIVGPNGSGKTTLLNLISGLYPLNRGAIRLGDIDLVGKRPEQVARLGVGRTFQTPKIIRELTVIENVRFGACNSERATGVEIALALPRARQESVTLNARAIELLSLVGLSARAFDRADELPHGQQRLVEIARALIGQPRLLLLDEPAAGLSLGELERLGTLMREIRRRGVTLVMVEHHIELVADVAQSVTVLEQGRVLVSGDPAVVFRHPEVIAAYTGGKS
jgi:branched-chain amino acid transport system permease protein